uniref:Uncharacterized protein n=1 Tax=Rhizophora mucronata TaxID=61149 RepID=A0A2P2PX93_RHIMU
MGQNNVHRGCFLDGCIVCKRYSGFHHHTKHLEKHCIFVALLNISKLF